MKKNRNILALILILAVTLAVLVAVAVFALGGRNAADTPTQPTQITQPTTLPTEAPTEPPTEPPVTKVATATVSSVGDMLMHMPVVNTGYNDASGKYDQLGKMFDYITDYTTSADLMVGNLETTLAGADFVHYSGKVGYSGYPQFNCPDDEVDAMKGAGFDVILTANNHSYDTRNTGFRRTLETVLDRGLTYLGTKLEAEEPDYIIADCNGIQIGLMCYTYETNSDPDKKAPNGLTMKTADAPLMNTFDYTNLEMFYQEVRESLAQMARQGVDATVLFIHWGNEYQTKQNKSQTAIAQALCDLGVDVIIGGHPHVVQPVDLLTSTKDENHKTVCLYSMGNAVSNQRRAKMNLKTGHTEDGVLFSVTFARYTDGTVILESADLLPTWVNLDTHPETGKKAYMILPLDNAVTDWKAAFGLSDNTLKNAEASYERTVKITGEGMTKVNTWLAQNQTDTETAIGVEK